MKAAAGYRSPRVLRTDAVVGDGATPASLAISIRKNSLNAELLGRTLPTNMPERLDRDPERSRMPFHLE